MRSHVLGGTSSSDRTFSNQTNTMTQIVQRLPEATSEEIYDIVLSFLVAISSPVQVPDEEFPCTISKNSHLSIAVNPILELVWKNVYPPLITNFIIKFCLHTTPEEKKNYCKIMVRDFDFDSIGDLAIPFSRFCHQFLESDGEPADVAAIGCSVL